MACAGGGAHYRGSESAVNGFFGFSDGSGPTALLDPAIALSRPNADRSTFFNMSAAGFTLAAPFTTRVRVHARNTQRSA